MYIDDKTTADPYKEYKEYREHYYRKRCECTCPYCGGYLGPRFYPQPYYIYYPHYPQYPYIGDIPQPSYTVSNEVTYKHKPIPCGLTFENE